MKAKVKAINFDGFPCIYWNDAAKLTYLQRRILVYSIQYYIYDDNCVSDRYYDACCIQLHQMMQECDIDDVKASMYYYVFYDFTPGTGYDLSSRLTREDYQYLTAIALYVLEQWNKLKPEKQKEMLLDGINRIEGLD